MGFDKQRFLKEKFEARIEEVKLPDMRVWFPDGEDPIFRVRGLTYNELAKVEETATRNKNLEAFIKAMAGKSSTEKTREVQNLLGVSDDNVPTEAAKRLEILTTGLIDPEFSMSDSVKFADRYPIEFGILTAKIFELTGRGQKVVEKPSPSGKTRTLKTASG